MASLRRCWVIVDGTQPTAFHSKEAEQLLPTLKQLQRTQPQVALMWFERGRLWPSPDAAKLALRERRQRPPAGRGRDWRPGGEHRDPKARPDIPRDVKRARFKKRLIEKSRSAAGGDREPDRRPPGTGSRSDRPWSGRPPADRPRSDNERQWDRPKADRRPSGRPPSERPRSDRAPSDGRPKGSSAKFGHKTDHRTSWERRSATPPVTGRRPGPPRGGPRGAKKGRGPK